MNSPKNLLIAVLALTTIGGAALAWHQYQELVALRAGALADSDRAALQKKIWDLEKANRELNDRLAAMRGGAGENAEEGALAATNDRAKGGEERRNGFRGRGEAQFAAIREAMNKPEVQALVSSAQKALVDARYAALFRSLNLSADDQAKLTQLLSDRQTARQDVFTAAREQGVNPRTDPTGFQKLVSDAESPINDSIKSLLGDSGYSQLTNYDQTMPQRNVVNALQQRLSYTDAPLHASQADQLVQILAQTAPPANTNATEPGGFGPRGGGDFGGGRLGEIAGGFGGGGGGIGAIAGPGAAPITSQAVAQAGTVLNSTQVSALQQLQQQQQTAQQLQQVIRSTWQQAGAAGGTAAPTTGGGGAPASGGTPATGGGRRGGG